ncbi:MAG: DUF4783 domain-containing protein [Bacteroidales bacterium]|nr:DUF4783 domain-containing protein [Bacteroidales bacterium]
MKKAVSIFLFFLTLASVQAQSDNQAFNSIKDIFIQNDYQKLSEHFANTLDITIESTDGTYGKQQATVLIKDFFEANKTTSFKIKHKGSSNENTHYAVCDLKSSNKNWSVYILLNKQSKIIQLQIED